MFVCCFCRIFCVMVNRQIIKFLFPNYDINICRERDRKSLTNRNCLRTTQRRDLKSNVVLFFGKFTAIRLNENNKKKSKKKKTVKPSTLSLL